MEEVAVVSNNTLVGILPKEIIIGQDLSIKILFAILCYIFPESKTSHFRRCL